MKRVFLIVLDGVGAGELPDAALYGDAGSATLQNLARAAGGLRLPVMGAMGLGNLAAIDGVRPVEHPSASWGRMSERSKGKDTVAGHWEMMGLVSETPFPTYPGGFPDEIMDAFERATGLKALWNRPASGTEIIERLGAEHMRTGKPIVYTSADSVFQIAAHEDVIPVERLYEICAAARAILVPPHNVCRVIARPFVGPPFVRTANRKDFPLAPHGPTALDTLASSGIEVISVGKVSQMFGGRGFSSTRKTASNAQGMAELDNLSATMERGLVFANLVDFDMLWGHRNDVAGFSRGLEEFDHWLGGFLKKLGPGDLMIITADHGLDPTTPSTDHSREYVPLLLHGPRPRPLGTRDGFCDIGATVLDAFGLKAPLPGVSMLPGQTN